MSYPNLQDKVSLNEINRIFDPKTQMLNINMESIKLI